MITTTIHLLIIIIFFLLFQFCLDKFLFLNKKMMMVYFGERVIYCC